MLIRPVRTDDYDAVLAIAKLAGFGMTSLPADEGVLREKIEQSVASFAGKKPGHESYFFVLEDNEKNTVVGTTGIKAHIGLNQPFYSYKLNTITQHSRDLELFSKHTLLQVVNDFTDCSEIGSLFLSPDYRRDRLGRLLSLCRFMFVAAFREKFSEQFIAEMRGVHDREGNSPFYNSIARHFFDMEFPKADYINATKGNQFISDLMPKYPIYMSLLPKEAQLVIGQPHPQSEGARAMLEREGFEWHGYVDIFDGGPTLQADRDELRVVKEAKTAQIAEVSDFIEAPKYMITNDRYADFRCVAGRLVVNAWGEAVISNRTARNLNVKIGDTIRFIPHTL